MRAAAASAGSASTAGRATSRGEELRPLCHVHGQIADAFEIGDDLEGGGDEAQIGRGGLIQRQRADALLVDRELHLIDRAVGVDDPAGELRVAFQQRPDGLADVGVDQASHGQDLLLERAQLGAEGGVDVVSFGHGYPYLPVT